MILHGSARYIPDYIGSFGIGGFFLLHISMMGIGHRASREIREPLSLNYIDFFSPCCADDPGILWGLLGGTNQTEVIPRGMPRPFCNWPCHCLGAQFNTLEARNHIH